MLPSRRCLLTRGPSRPWLPARVTHVCSSPSSCFETGHSFASSLSAQEMLCCGMRSDTSASCSDLKPTEMTHSNSRRQPPLRSYLEQPPLSISSPPAPYPRLQASLRATPVRVALTKPRTPTTVITAAAPVRACRKASRGVVVLSARVHPLSPGLVCASFVLLDVWSCAVDFALRAPSPPSPFWVSQCCHLTKYQADNDAPT